MPGKKKEYHHDYFFGPEGMTEHDDPRQADLDPKNQRPGEEPEHHSQEPIHHTDEQVRARIMELLSQDPNIDISEIELGVHLGEVKITGTVSSRWMKQKVVSDIAEISGVRDVDNQLQVDRPPEREIA
ncbi:MAG: BON domain-containing protein [Bdellovibrionota bacterium]